MSTKSCTALYHRAKFYLLQGRWHDALDDLDAVVEMNPDLTVAVASRAMVRDRLGDYDDALDDAERAVGLDPGSAIHHFLRGFVLSHLRKIDAALASFDEAIRLDDQFAFAYQERSVARTIKGDYDLALTDIFRLIALEPDNAQAYAHRSMLLHLRGDAEPAVADYARALELDPRVLLSGWSQPLADHARNRTIALLADAVDGLRGPRIERPTVSVARPAVVVERQPIVEPTSRKVPEVAPVPLFPTLESLPREVVEVSVVKAPQAAETVFESPVVKVQATAPALVEVKTAPIEKPVRPAAVTPSPALRPIEVTKSDGSRDPSETARESRPTGKPSAAYTPRKETIPFAPSQTIVSTPAFSPIAPASPRTPVPTKTIESKVAIREAPSVQVKPAMQSAAPTPTPRTLTQTATIAAESPKSPPAFDASVDKAIERLLASVSADVEPFAKKSPLKKPIDTPAKTNVAPVESRPMPQPHAPPLKPIDCPLCRHRLPPAEVLTGGRFRCGNCDAIFFPTAAAPPKPVPQPTVKPRPVTRPRPADDDDEPTLLQRWRKPKPLAISGAVALLLLYFVVPTSLFGDSRFHTVYAAKGEATFEGKAIPGAIVMLHPIDPPSRDFPSAKAIVGPDGRFSLGAYAVADGAAAGEYKVSIVLFPPAAPNEVRDENYRPRNVLPPRYANPETSGLKVRITSGENQLEPFRLKR